MLIVDIPGHNTLHLEHLVLDYNGTLACDGILLDGVSERIARLADRLTIHVVTGDSFGKAAEQLAGMPWHLAILETQRQSAAKAAYVADLGPSGVVCIGNGSNDRQMMAAAALAIAVIQKEGAAAATLLAADIVVRQTVDALDLLINPQRLMATLRQ